MYLESLLGLHKVFIITLSSKIPFNVKKNVISIYISLTISITTNTFYMYATAAIMIVQNPSL